jgi:hypothetical protein
VTVQRGDRDRIAQPEPVELEGVRVATRIVDLVRHEDDRLARPAENARDLLVSRRHAGARVGHEDDQIGLLHRAPRLLRNLTRERRGIGDVDAARVHEDEPLPRPLADDFLAIPRHTGGLEHDGLTCRGEAVDQRRLADVREADDGDRAQERGAHRPAFGL